MRVFFHFYSWFLSLSTFVLVINCSFFLLSILVNFLARGENPIFHQNLDPLKPVWLDQRIFRPHSNRYDYTKGPFLHCWASSFYIFLDFRYLWEMIRTTGRCVSLEHWWPACGETEHPFGTHRNSFSFTRSIESSHWMHVSLNTGISNLGKFLFILIHLDARSYSIYDMSFSQTEETERRYFTIKSKENPSTNFGLCPPYRQPW